MQSRGILALAFSGGLDTSYCVARLRELGWTVHTVHVDTGGGRFDHHHTNDLALSAAELVRRAVAPDDRVLIAENTVTTVPSPRTPDLPAARP